MAHRSVRGRHVHDAKGKGHLVDARETERIGGRRADGDERVHVGREPHERLEARYEVVPVHKKDRRGEKQLRDRTCHHSAHSRECGRLGQA